MDWYRSTAAGGTSRVTWERCPRCGERAAVGWRTADDAGSAWPPVEFAVEFDCPTGCHLSIEEMVWSFQSSVAARTEAFPRSGGQSSDAPFDDREPYRPAGVPAESPTAGDGPARRIRAMELIPGHAETAAEVWVWHGVVPEVRRDARTWVSLRSDDWPMCPTMARRLAAALLAAAAVADGAPSRPAS